MTVTPDEIHNAILAERERIAGMADDEATLNDNEWQKHLDFAGIKAAHIAGQAAALRAFAKSIRSLE